MDEEGLDPDALEAELAARRRHLVPLHDPDLPEPERPHARRATDAGGSPSSRRRTTWTCSRTTRTGSSATRARRQPRCTRSRAASGSRSRRRSRRRSRPGLRVGWFVVPEGLRSAFDDRAVSTYISPPLLPAGDRARALRARRVRAEPRARPRDPSRPARRDALGARARAAPAVRRGAAPRAATSSGSTSRGRRRRRAARPRDGGRRDVRPRLRLLRRATAERAPRGSRSPTRRPSGSSRASASSPGCSERYRLRLRHQRGPITASAAPSAMLSRISHGRRVSTVKKTKSTDCLSSFSSRKRSAYSAIAAQRTSFHGMRRESPDRRRRGRARRSRADPMRRRRARPGGAARGARGAAAAGGSEAHGRGAERRTRRVPREGAEPLAAEIAVLACRDSALAHVPSVRLPGSPDGQRALWPRRARARNPLRGRKSRNLRVSPDGQKSCK